MAKKKRVAIVCADTHLQDRAWVNRAIEGDSYHSFHQIVDLAIKYDVPIIAAGDLIDKSRNPSGPIVAMVRELERLEQAELRLYYVQGQHEMADVPWLEASSAAVHMHGEGKWFEFGPLTAQGLDYQPAGQLLEALDGLQPGADILVAHQVWGDLMGDIAAPQGGFHDIPDVSTLITGDYHKEYIDKMYRGKDGQELNVLNPGSTCMQSIDEPPEKFVAILRDDGSFRKVQLKTRPVIICDPILQPDDVDWFIENVGTAVEEAADNEELPENIRKPIIRVTYSYKLSDAKRRASKLIGNAAHIFWNERPPLREEKAARVRDGKGGAATLASELLPYLEDQDAASLEPDLRRLMEAEDVAGELRRMREEALA
jgi:hypothetical protein